MKTVQIEEDGVKLVIPDPKEYALSSKAPVFYNPEMKMNRDISVLLLQAVGFKDSVLDMLAATGARGLRIKKAIPKSNVVLNDKNPNAVELIKKNAKLNKLKVEVLEQDAHFKFPMVYHYVDVDPFGTPAPFLDPAIKSLKNGGILAVTATDTSALCGTYTKACIRKYGSKPLKNECMKETGLRILIKKVQEIAAQYEIALTPIFSHSTRHYMRVYFKSKSGAKETDKILKHHGFYETAGPLWLGKLWDRALLKEMVRLANKQAVKKELKGKIPTFSLVRDLYFKESLINTVGFYDLHKLCSKLKLPEIPRYDDIIEKLKKKGYKASRTHFSKTGIKTNAPYKDVVKIIK